MQALTIGSLNTSNGVKLMNFVNSIHICCSPQIDIFSQSSAYDLVCRSRHNFLKASVNNVQFCCAFEQQ
jgi:hypothetical protein